MSGAASPSPVRNATKRTSLTTRLGRRLPSNLRLTSARVSHVLLCCQPCARQRIATNRSRSASNMRTAWRPRATVHAALLIRWVLCSGHGGRRVPSPFKRDSSHPLATNPPPAPRARASFNHCHRRRVGGRYTTAWLVRATKSYYLLGTMT